MSKNMMNRNGWLGALILGSFFLASLVFVGSMLKPENASAADLVVYKSPSCGCCKKWVQHMQENGFSVEVHEQYNVTPKKDEYGVPRRLRSCHTAKVGGYVVEGHVPADVVKRLLEEKPTITGVAVPGMPMGSPGMEGPRKDPYEVIAFREDGGARVYARR
jgi:hypothetical protein